LALLSEKNPLKACGNIFKICQQTKAQIALERRIGVIKRLQQQFGSEINLLPPNLFNQTLAPSGSSSDLNTKLMGFHRHLVKEGQLTKVHFSNPNKSSGYFVFLFNDILVYASAGVQTRYKFHRALHLSLCTLQSIEKSNQFRIICPQKTVLFAAANEKSKQSWLEELLKLIITQINERNSFILQAGKTTPNNASGNNSKEHSNNAANNATGSNSQSLTDTPELEWRNSEVLRSYSTFIAGESSADPAGSSAQLSKEKYKFSYCRLCLRNYSLFRRRVECRVCGQERCNACYQHRVVIDATANNNIKVESVSSPTNTRAKRVCDSCYGFLTGLIEPKKQAIITMINSNNNNTIISSNISDNNSSSIS
jgi:hypothetical protein